MTFTEHLSELRIRIIHSAIAIVVCIVVCWFFSDKIFYIVASPLSDPRVQTSPAATTDAPNGNPGNPDDAATEGNPRPQPPWVTFTFMEGFLVRLRLAAYAGLLLALPYVVYQVCAFVFPGLKPREKNAVGILLTGGGSLAVVGVLIAYFCVFRSMLPFLMQFAPPGVQVNLRMGENVTLVLQFLLGFAVAFQFPMAVLVLVYLGLLSPATLKKYRKQAIVGLAVVSAILTPSPDPGSMLMMLAPLWLLFEGSIWLSYLVIRRKKAAG